MKKAIIALMQKLGVYEPLVNNKATNEQINTLVAELKKEHNLTLAQAIEHLNSDEEEEEQQAHQEETTFTAEDSAALQAAMGSINAALNPNGGADEGGAGGSGTQASAGGSASGEQQATTPDVQQLVGGIGKLIGAVEQLSQKAEADTPQVVTAKPTIMICGPGTSATHLFGIEHEMFSLEKPWNKMAANKQPILQGFSRSQKEQLYAEFDQFGEDLRTRFQNLHASGQIPTMMAGNLDYSELDSDLGAYYRVRRQDAIITYILSLKQVPYPVQYNVQDEQNVIDAFFGKSFSQSYQSGRVFAGGAKFDWDKSKVHDVMFKFLFSDLKDLEKTYIGYLNRESSDPIKWGFIEWIMVRCATIQNNEKQERRVRGVQIPSQTGKAAYYMYASEGFLTKMMLNSLVKPSIYAFADLNKPDVNTGANYVEYVREFVKKVHLMRGMVDDLELHMNEIYVPFFLESYREKYKGDNDFNGEKPEVKNFPLPKIVRVPNMGANNFQMWLMPAGAIEIQEDAPGEYYAYYFQRDLEQLMVCSYCKEGTYIYSGRRFADKAAMIASKGKNTQFYSNLPFTQLVADANTFDAFDNTFIASGANTGATNITDVENAAEGELYTLYCNNTDNATGIAKSGKFSEISSAHTPTAVGDFIRFIYDPVADKFHDYDRMVDGTYAKNTVLKAPELVDNSI